MSNWIMYQNGSRDQLSPWTHRKRRADINKYWYVTTIGILQVKQSQTVTMVVNAFMINDTSELTVTYVIWEYLIWQHYLNTLYIWRYPFILKTPTVCISTVLDWRKYCKKPITDATDNFNPKMIEIERSIFPKIEYRLQCIVVRNGVSHRYTLSSNFLSCQYLRD